MHISQLTELINGMDPQGKPWILFRSKLRGIRPAEIEQALAGAEKISFAGAERVALRSAQPPTILAPAANGRQKLRVNSAKGRQAANGKSVWPFCSCERLLLAALAPAQKEEYPKKRIVIFPGGVG